MVIRKEKFKEMKVQRPERIIYMDDDHTLQNYDNGVIKKITMGLVMSSRKRIRIYLQESVSLGAVL